MIQLIKQRLNLIILILDIAHISHKILSENCKKLVNTHSLFNFHYLTFNNLNYQNSSMSFTKSTSMKCGFDFD